MNLNERLTASSVTFRDEPLESALQQLSGLGFTRLDLVAIRHFCAHFDPLLVSVGEEECVRVRELIAGCHMQTVSVTTYPANPLANNLNGDDWVSGVDAYVRLGLVLQARFLILPPGRPAPSPDRWRGTAQRAKPWQREAVMRTLNAHMLPAVALQSGSLLRTAQQGLDFLSILGLRSAGLAVDPAHLAAMGEDPAEAIRRMNDAIAFVVLRDTDGENFNLPPGMGRLDYPGILAALNDIGYDGPLVLAIDDMTIPPQQRGELLKRGWDYLDQWAMGQAA